MMPRCIAAGLALAACLLGCGADGDPVRIITTEDRPDLCGLNYVVVDVVVDPLFGTGIKGGGPLTWPSGFTARRAGREVEVLSPEGQMVLKTGGRYRISSTSYEGGGATCGVSPCPDCEPGSSGVL